MKVAAFTLLLLTYALTTAGAFEYASAPEVFLSSDSLWRKRNVVVVPAEGIELKSDADLVVDELVLRGPLITGGHALRIDALRISFEKDGRVVAFSKPAREGIAGLEGPRGLRAREEGAQGGNGVTPPKAAPGADGDQHPSSIVIYADQISGKPVIDVRGEAGGQGGHGGQGGAGGAGGPGRNAKTDCFWGKTKGTDGGPGGQGAPGGHGGDGGRGGAPVPLVMATGRSTKLEILSGGGRPGDPGLPGSPGLGGEGGNGGFSATRSCGPPLFGWRNSSPGGNDGSRGPGQVQYGQPGQRGEAAPVLDVSTEPLPNFPESEGKSAGVILADLNSLGALREKVAVAWADFHWSRTVIFLILDTLTLDSEHRDRELRLEELEGIVDTRNLDFLTELNRDRLNDLRTIWMESLITPLRSLGSSTNPSVPKHLRLAELAFETFEVIARQSSDLDDQLVKLGRLQIVLANELKSSLDNAISACQQFNAEKQRVLPQLVSLTSTYEVPICAGNPDMRLAKNIDRRIVIYRQNRAHVPPEFATHFSQSARNMPRLSLVPAAFAEESFDVLQGSVHTLGNERFKMPRPGTWIASEIGVFIGFPEIERVSRLKRLDARLGSLLESLAPGRSK